MGVQREVRVLAPGLKLSLLPEAPDHGRPELAVVQGRRVVVVAEGPGAFELFGTMDEAAARKAVLEVGLE